MHLKDDPAEPRPAVGTAGWVSWRFVVAGLVVAVVTLGLWNWRFRAAPGFLRGVRVEPGNSASTDGDAERRAAAARSRSRPFMRSEGGVAGLEAIPWQARLRTNGTLDGDRMRQDEAYSRKVVQSDRLKTLIRSPAKETPEFGQIVAFADRKGLPLAATVDFYNIVWATRDYERRVSAVATPAEKEAIDLVRDLELADFGRQFQRDFAVEAAPLLEELFVLPIHPTVFMGIPHRAFVGGEALLSD